MHRRHGRKPGAARASQARREKAGVTRAAKTGRGIATGTHSVEDEEDSRIEAGVKCLTDHDRVAAETQGIDRNSRLGKISGFASRRRIPATG